MKQAYNRVANGGRMLAVKNSIVEFEPGELVIRENTSSDGLYIVKEGQLEVYKTNKNGDVIPIAIINSGEYLGETALLMDELHSSNVIALSKVSLIKLPKEKVLEQIKSSPVWLVALAKGLIERLHNTNDMVKKSGYVDDKVEQAAKAIRSNNKNDDDAA